MRSAKPKIPVAAQAAPAYLSRLPTHVLIHIFHYLPANSDLAACTKDLQAHRALAVFQPSGRISLDNRRMQSTLLKQWASSQSCFNGLISSLYRLETSYPSFILKTALETPRGDSAALAATFTLCSWLWATSDPQLAKQAQLTANQISNPASPVKAATTKPEQPSVDTIKKQMAQLPDSYQSADQSKIKKKIHALKKDVKKVLNSKALISPEDLTALAHLFLPKLNAALSATIDLKRDHWYASYTYEIHRSAAKVLHTIRNHLAEVDTLSFHERLRKVAKHNMKSACVIALEFKPEITGLLTYFQLQELLELTAKSITQSPQPDIYSRFSRYKLLIKYHKMLVSVLDPSTCILLIEELHKILTEGNEEENNFAGERHDYSLNLLTKLVMMSRRIEGYIKRVLMTYDALIKHVYTVYDDGAAEVETGLIIEAICTLGKLINERSKEKIIEQIITPPEAYQDSERNSMSYRYNILARIPRNFARNVYHKLVSFLSIAEVLDYLSYENSQHFFCSLAPWEQESCLDGWPRILNEDDDDTCIEGLRRLTYLLEEITDPCLASPYAQKTLADAIDTTKKRIITNLTVTQSRSCHRLEQYGLDFIKTALTLHVSRIGPGQSTARWLLENQHMLFARDDQLTADPRSDINQLCLACLPVMRGELTILPTDHPLRCIQQAYSACLAKLAHVLACAARPTQALLADAPMVTLDTTTPITDLSLFATRSTTGDAAAEDSDAHSWDDDDMDEWGTPYSAGGGGGGGGGSKEGHPPSQGGLF